MPLTGLRRSEALAGSPTRSRSWRFRLAVLVSLLIHVAIGILLLVTIRRERQSEQLPPPSTVTMLFESGRRTGPTLPDPGLQATPPVPPAPPSPPAEEGLLPPAKDLPLPPQVLEPAPSEPAPSEPAPTKPTPPPEPAPVQPAPLEPLPPMPKPNESAPAVPLPPRLTPAEPAPPAAEVLPPPPRVLRPAPLPQAPPPPVVESPPLRPPPKPAAPLKPPDFPVPMNYSFGTPNLTSRASPQARSRPHIPGTIDMSLGPASKGVADPTPLSDREQEAAGADWRNELSRWVAEHAYYPEQARREAQEGDAKVRVLTAPNGRVREVELIGKSGSMWLDLALLSLFRDRQIPPLPRGINEPIEFNFTMHYILIRRR